MNICLHVGLVQADENSNRCFWHFWTRLAYKWNDCVTRTRVIFKFPKIPFMCLYRCKGQVCYLQKKGVSVQQGLMKENETIHNDNMLEFWTPNVKNVTMKHTTKRYRNHTEMSDPPLAINMPKYITYIPKWQQMLITYWIRTQTFSALYELDKGQQNVCHLHHLGIC